MKNIIVVGLVLALSGCGGGGQFNESRGGTSSRALPIAHGPISRACLNSDRKARSRQLCGCIQAVADRNLNGLEQRRAVKFYADPHLAQQTRQSDRRLDEKFWKVYKAYSDEAAQRCA